MWTSAQPLNEREAAAFMDMAVYMSLVLKLYEISLVVKRRPPNCTLLLKNSRRYVESISLHIQGKQAAMACFSEKRRKKAEDHHTIRMLEPIQVRFGLDCLKSRITFCSKLLTVAIEKYGNTVIRGKFGLGLHDLKNHANKYSLVGRLMLYAMAAFLVFFDAELLDACELV